MNELERAQQRYDQAKADAERIAIVFRPRHAELNEVTAELNAARYDADPAHVADLLTRRAGLRFLLDIDGPLGAEYERAQAAVKVALEPLRQAQGAAAVRAKELQQAERQAAEAAARVASLKAAE